VASSRVFIGDVVSVVFFLAFGAVLPISNTFNMCWKIVGRLADNKGNSGFIDATGDGC